MSAPLALNGAARLRIGEVADQDLAAARRRRSELVTELRKLNVRIADMETVQLAVGVASQPDAEGDSPS